MRGCFSCEAGTGRWWSSEPVLLLRLNVMDLPGEGDLTDLDLPGEGDLTDLYRALLEWNATDMVHGAYGIEEGEIILSDTLELQTLDYEEVQASVESLQYAASSHLGKIKSLAGVDGGGSDASDDRGSEGEG